MPRVKLSGAVKFGGVTHHSGTEVDLPQEVIDGLPPGVARQVADPDGRPVDEQERERQQRIAAAANRLRRDVHGKPVITGDPAKADPIAVGGTPLMKDRLDAMNTERNNAGGALVEKDSRFADQIAVGQPEPGKDIVAPSVLAGGTTGAAAGVHPANREGDKASLFANEPSDTAPDPLGAPPPRTTPMANAPAAEKAAADATAKANVDAVQGDQAKGGTAQPGIQGDKGQTGKK